MPTIFQNLRDATDSVPLMEFPVPNGIREPDSILCMADLSSDLERCLYRLRLSSFQNCLKHQREPEAHGEQMKQSTSAV